MVASIGGQLNREGHEHHFPGVPGRHLVWDANVISIVPDLSSGDNLGAPPPQSVGARTDRRPPRGFFDRVVLLRGPIRYRVTRARVVRACHLSPPHGPWPGAPSRSNLF